MVIFRKCVLATWAMVAIIELSTAVQAESLPVFCQTDYKGRSQLMQAVKHGDVNDIRGFLAHGKPRSPAEQKCYDEALGVIGWKPAKASDEEQIEMVNLLIENGANVNSAIGTPALHLAARNKQTKIALYLLTKGASPKLRSGYSQSTPLHEAAFGDDTELTLTLLKAGADVNARDEYGNSPLMEAARQRSFKVAQILINHKADPNLKNNSGASAYSLAHSDNSDAMKALLKKGGAKEHIKVAATAQVVVNAGDNISPANKRKLELYAAQMETKAAQIRAIESEMSSIGWSGPEYNSKSVTGYQCENGNSNCRATYQGGGETVSSQYKRIDNSHKMRDLEAKRRSLITEYDILVLKYNEIASGKKK